MSFFAQVPQSPGSRLAEQLGLNIGQGIARNFPTPEQQVQKGLLQQAFKGLLDAPKGDYLSQLSAIAPTLLTTAGGAEALAELSLILAKSAQALSVSDVIRSRQ